MEIRDLHCIMYNFEKMHTIGQCNGDGGSSGGPLVPGVPGFQLNADILIASQPDSCSSRQTMMMMIMDNILDVALQKSPQESNWLNQVWSKMFDFERIIFS